VNSWLPLLWLWLISIAMMAAGWWWQRTRSNATIVDALWAAGLGIGALLMAILEDGEMWPRIAVALAGGLWSLRLASHLFARVRHDPEDGRYQAMRRHWQGSAQWKFFIFFQAQTVVIVLFALPFLAVARTPRTNAFWLVVGGAIWLLSVIGETIADRQLRRFRADAANRAKVCRVGLWRYSRHPNYFFEWLHWFAYVAFAASSPVWGLTWVGPVAMYAFLRWFTGIPWTEMQALRTRGDDYRAYQQSTSVLIPWFPKQPVR